MWVTAQKCDEFNSEEREKLNFLLDFQSVPATSGSHVRRSSPTARTKEKEVVVTVPASNPGSRNLAQRRTKRTQRKVGFNIFHGIVKITK